MEGVCLVRGLPGFNPQHPIWFPPSTARPVPSPRAIFAILCYVLWLIKAAFILKLGHVVIIQFLVCLSLHGQDVCDITSTVDLETFSPLGWTSWLL